jgi:uncharacterized delta-60 repeat protein
MIASKALFLFESLEPRRVFSVFGDVDITFGLAGTTPLITDFRPTLNNDDQIHMHMQVDGKVVVAGSFDDESFFIQRYTSDGRKDPTFLGGIRSIPGIEMDYITGVRARADGSIFIIEDQLVRLDSSGKFVASYEPNQGEIVDWAVDASGNVIVADQYAILRYKPDGTIDDSFNRKPVNLSGSAFVKAIEPTADGKIVVHAATQDFDGNEYDHLFRLNSDGALDESFSNGLIVIHWRESYRSMKLTPDGSIILSGGYGWYEDDFIIRKFLPNGSPDVTFGLGGYVRTNLGSNMDLLSYAIAEADGGVLAVGNFNDTHFVKVRYLPDGSIDTEWGNNGRMYSQFRGGVLGWSASSDIEGRVVVLALSNEDVFGDWDKPVAGFFLTRYNFTNNWPGKLSDEETDDGLTDSEGDEDQEEEEEFDDTDWWYYEEEEEEQTDEYPEDDWDRVDEEDEDLAWEEDSDVWE